MIKTNNNTAFVQAARRATLSLLLLLSAGLFLLRAQERAYKFYYPVGNAVIDSTYMTNALTMEQLRNLLTTTDLSNLETLIIESGSSPDGGEALNTRLAIRRGEALGAFLEANLPGGILEGKTTVRYNGEDWEGLRKAIAESTDLSESLRTRTLSILDSNVSNNVKKSRLNALPGYKKEIADRFFPELRYAFLYLTFGIPEPEIPNIDTDIEMTEMDLILPILELLEVNTPHVTPVSYTVVKKPLFAVSTNVLFDAAITPNFALELPLGKRWSIYGEYTFPWWVTSKNNRAWQILKWDLGTRYWMSSRNSAMDVLTGHFLGLDLSGGYYDIEPDNKGWQGEFILAGLEYGYAWRLGKKGNWRLGLSIGAGWMGTEYRYYEGTDDSAHLLYKHTGRYNWFGPVKAEISIKYLFNRTVTRRATR